MSRTRTFAQLIADVRSRTNTEVSTLVTDAEIGEWLNQELAELWGRICNGAGAPFYRSIFPINVVLGQNLYPLPDDFMSGQGVEATFQGQPYSLRSFMQTERALLIGRVRYPWRVGTMYRIQAANIEFQPVSEAFYAELFYTPCQPRLVDPTDTFDGFNGWETAAIYGACATVNAKEETDPSFYEGRKGSIYRQIDAQIAARDGMDPERVQDVRPDPLLSDLLGMWGP